jgi:quercetin dioxygenase-like cupin family protein
LGSDEVFYVLDGEIEFLLDGEWHQASAGSTVFVPAGTVHAFRNARDRPARQLVVGPVEVAELIAELSERPRERWEEVHERHRSHYAHGPEE